MLTGSKVLEEIEKGNICISPFDKKQLNPNSYNVRLGSTLKVYTDNVLDFNKDNPSKTIESPVDGFVLQPGELYLGNIVERVSTDKYISAVDSRSSIGRLGILIHATAGFGDIGFDGNYTLEIFCVKPVRIYPDMLIRITKREALAEGAKQKAVEAAIMLVQKYNATPETAAKDMNAPLQLILEGIKLKQCNGAREMIKILI